MGITGLWDVINDASEIVRIADYATRFYEQHKRPLRIAVDEACWRFTNLTEEQVIKIRQGEPAANPVEKTVLWRVLRLMKLNIQLFFVYDGPRKPQKRGKQGGSLVEKELVKLLHQLFDHLKIPYHQAPGEAEAECAALQREGIVDAVWSDDGDALMFGCTTLIKQYKEGQNRKKDYIRVFTADALREKHDFSRDSFLLIAMLSGGDYNVKGLPGCGPQTARPVAKDHWSVATAARDVQLNQLPQWRKALELTLRKCGKVMQVPASFPDFKALGHYREPAISTVDQLHTLRGLRQGWDRPIDQQQRSNNVRYGIVFKRTRRAKVVDGEAPPAKTERKIMFAPLLLVDIDGIQKPLEEDWNIWAGQDGRQYDPTEPIDCEILDCFLRDGLPKDSVAASPTPTRKKRKADDDLEGSAPIGETIVPVQSSSQLQSTDTPRSPPPEKRARAKKNVKDGEVVKPAHRKAKMRQTAEEDLVSPPPVFRLPSSAVAPSRPPRPFHASSSLALSSVATPHGSDQNIMQKAYSDVASKQATKSVAHHPAFALTRAESIRTKGLIPRNDHPRTTPLGALQPAAKRESGDPYCPTPSGPASVSGYSNTETTLKAGEVIDPTALRRLRAAAFINNISSRSPVATTCPSRNAQETIDLT
ncbi:hypothetical protein LTR78_010251 [Recurvomyces mirabilis]|uniref:XPG-I domain-containing protein n=1 Tax=Recurvomyces mirabilis TaxID=574656 RepID=A0AAE0TM04_9PEZI|nr:hypothetical protein LTR78_010251 [Recurvomyces mirabilis]